EDALAAFDETIRLFPRDVVARAARGETLRELGRLEDALAAFDETIRLLPRNEVARNARGETLRELGRLEDALAAFDETIRLLPRDVVARNARGETLRELGRPEDALAAFDETIRLFPRSEVARNARAHCLAALGYYADVEQSLSHLYEACVTRGDWIGLHILAMTRLRQGDAAGALEFFERGVRECGFFNVRLYFRSAIPLAYLRSNQPARAAEQVIALVENK